MIFQCKHKWELISEKTTESAFEHAMKQIPQGRQLSLPWQLCTADRKYIQVFQCANCGKLERFVETLR